MITRNPNFVEAHGCLAGLLSNKNDLPNSILSYERALDINPNHTATLINFGFTLKNQVWRAVSLSSTIFNPFQSGVIVIRVEGDENLTAFCCFGLPLG